MTRLLIAIACLVFLGPGAALAHPGALDAYGGHYDHAHGGYHFHRGPLAGQSFPTKEEALAALAGPPHDSTGAALPKETEALITRYLAELSRVERSKASTSLEVLFATTDTLRDYLLGERRTAGVGDLADRPAWDIESLSQSEYDDLCHRLRGVLLNRDETLVAEPDSSTFLPLARKRGLASDREFMEIYFRTRPIAWPSYVEQQTDYSGCDMYGSGLLVSLYGAWSSYREKYPGKYLLAIQEQLDDIEDCLADAKCACGGPDDVTREFELFLQQFPKSPLAPKVRQELDAVKVGQSKIRFHC